ncbi:TetR/AcrR family transcriptional regulator [Pseudolysinimonas sp.]|uniref:TetR/AcrR family transcriptional regulator n=1 Tax=Pseudolysinimonas sp. TaxID=2680009 RepID=UPI003F80B829
MPRRDALENRAALLAAARVVLNRDLDATLEAIASEAGLTRRSVYGHFATRDELLRELVSTGTARVAGELAAVAHPDPLVRLALVAARMWAEVDDVRVMTLFAVRGPFQDLIARELEPVRRLLREAVEEGAAAGRIRADIPAATLGRLIEAAAIAVLDEANRTRLTAAAGRRYVMLSVLSTAGLSAADAAALVDATPELETTR